MSGYKTLNNNTNINASWFISELNVLQTINNNSAILNSINESINNSSSGLNIIGTPNINFNVRSQLTTINLSGSSVFHNALGVFS